MNKTINFDEATKPQISAADPSHASWVSANAGSGKTRVLTDRVARLLLIGVPPQRILCLTFTIAAANNMQVRLFERLGEWSMLSDRVLYDKLLELGEPSDSLGANKLKKARTLFARALETPGGLKIQTIHAFCASLLKRFPLEAGVSPNFKQIDALASRQLQLRILDEMALEKPHIYEPIIGNIPEQDITTFLDKIVIWQEKFERPVNRQKIRDKFLPDLTGSHEASMAEDEFESIDAAAGEQRWHEIIRQETELFDQIIDQAVKALFSNDDLIYLQKLINCLRRDREFKTSTKQVEPLNKILSAEKTEDSVHALAKIFLTSPSSAQSIRPKTSFPRTRLLEDLEAPLVLWLEGFRVRIMESRDVIIRVYAAKKTLALHEFASEFIERYDQRKREGAQLDFSDLILKSLALLQNHESARWVLYRLDGGIDHVLIDEAQDVSPTQWKIISEIANEFSAGQGAQERPRTIFAVGDEKQSIYGFLDAAPEKFGVMRDGFRDRFEAAQLSFIENNLHFSFRSSRAILALVDAVFSDCTAPGFADGVTHRVFNENLPGRVDLWPFIDATKNEQDDDWDLPDAIPSEAKSHIKLARAIADAIADMLDNKELLPLNDRALGVKARPVRLADIMILLRRRSDLFYAIIQALKDKGLDVAGADRLKLIEELPIRDLTALLSFLAFHHDDLSLAAVLRSPIFGLSEDELYELAYNRGPISLWQSLKRKKKRFPKIVGIIDDLILFATSASPYEILERVLTHHGGRDRLIARLGREIEETMDSYLQQALSYEEDNSASLVGFLEWLTTETEIKRQPSHDADEIRVMTIHGTKGLESPIIILPDTKHLSASPSDLIETSHDDDTPLFMMKREQSSPLNDLALDAKRRWEAEEDFRLLYVALTRAESWLIVCGEGKCKPDCWYDRIQMAMKECQPEERECAARTTSLHHQGRRFSTGEWPTSPTVENIPGDTAVELPDWAQSLPTFPDPPLPTLSPSQLGGSESLDSSEATTKIEEAGMTARAFGTRLHLLLEHLPQVPRPSRQKAARSILALEERDSITDSDFEEVMSAAVKLLDDPSLTDLFAKSTIPEAELTAISPTLDGRKLHGFIDRLCVSEEKILAVDYKSNQRVPTSPDEISEGILRQLGAYEETLTTIFPHHTIEMAILWTRSAQLMTVPHSLCQAALQRASSSLS